jgi:hypothetical protein
VDWCDQSVNSGEAVVVRKIGQDHTVQSSAHELSANSEMIFSGV